MSNEMKKDLKVVMGYYNEKGNVSNKVRNAIKEKAMPLIVETLDTLQNGASVGRDGAVYVPLFENESGETIYARGEFTISTKDPQAELVKPEKKKKDTQEVIVDIPDLD